MSRLKPQNLTINPTSKTLYDGIYSGRECSSPRTPEVFEVSMKGTPRFYSVFVVRGTRGLNGEYLLPDLDYPGRVLISEGVLNEWIRLGWQGYGD
jgi:hypothetical protein